MNNSRYYKQVALLLSVIPEIAIEPRFALHGGTAINLFDRDMPRLSIDIDLTYIPNVLFSNTTRSAIGNGKSIFRYVGGAIYI